MLCFSAIVPSSPLIRSAEENERTQALWKDTRNGLEHLRREFRAAEVEYAVIISQYLVRDEVFGIDCAERIQCDLRDQGDLKEYWYNGAPIAAHELLSSSAPLAAASTEKAIKGLNSFALSLLSPDSATRIVPVFLQRYASPEVCVRFGRKLMEAIQESSKRYGIIVTGEFTALHGNETRPQEVSSSTLMPPTHQEVAEALKRKAVSKLIEQVKKRPEEWDASYLPALLILAAIMSEISCKFKFIAYEAPLGPGSLTAQYIL